MKKYVIGIDEVGRGALAGPVTVVAVLIPKNLKPSARGGSSLGGKTFNLKPTLRDSKKLSPSQREKWFKFFKNHPQIKYTLAKVFPRSIEKINISRAANLAALRAYLRLIKSFKFQVPSSRVYLDGGLFLGNGQKRIPAKTVVKGDEKIQAIQIASIIAKVSRDKLMTRLAKKYPKYGFEIHKGYGTRAHLAAIKKYGASEIHRLTFISKYFSIKKSSI